MAACVYYATLSHKLTVTIILICCLLYWVNFKSSNINVVHMCKHVCIKTGFNFVIGISPFVLLI